MLIPPYGLITQKLERRQLKPTDVMKSEGQSNLEGKKIGRYEGRLFTLKSLSSNPPTLLSSTNHPSPLPLSHKGKALHTSLKRNAAFTLAEVLITLGIIGIVAALTLPALIANYQKQVTVTKLKKIYSTLTNAYQSAIYEYGPPENWDYPQTSNITAFQFFEKYISPFMATPPELININPFNYYTVKNYNGDDVNYATLFSKRNTQKVIRTSDGMCIIPWTNNQFLEINVDINCSGGPNILGRDVFDVAELWYFRQNFSVPELDTLTKGEVTREQLISDCSSHNYRNGSHARCMALIVYDGWEIKDDYPW